ncbi:transketolase [Tianweitania populi]|uniref:Transketolase n=1 Tax=Tianweitania populi TaxID=1607949 RepID=A0A8J3DR25_9HYPH|nr:transketolase [Tianweitania populi]GHD20671.1 transketolase [Tianweitania populi]
MSEGEPADRRNLSEAYLIERAKFIRLETMRLTRIAGAGHYSSTFSAAELFAALYYGHLRLDPKNPKWEDRDRFVLSKGHAAIGLYPVLADLGFYPLSKLDDFTRLGSAFGDHPDMKKIPGIDFSSGSLGHGLSIALGMALAGRLTGRTYRSYCMLGDGELNEGQIWEAAMAAGHFKLQGLVGIVDRNQLSIDGPTEKVMSVEPLADRFTSFGWDVKRIDGHDLSAIMATLSALKPAGTGRPQMIIADTVKGRGVKYMELSLDWHVGNLVGDDYDDAWAEIEAGLQPFEKEDA